MSMKNDQSSLETTVVPLDPLALLKRDPVLAEKAFNHMPLAEQLRYVLRAPLAQRPDLCALAQESRALIQALPAEEVWLTIRAVGMNDAIDFFQATAPEQVQFCLDVECWHKDQWVPDATFDWLRLVAAGGADKILEYFTHGDIELIGLFCKRWVSVYLRVLDEDPAQAVTWPRHEPPMTLDGVCYWQVADEHIEQWLRPMLELYGKMDPEGLRRLLNAVIAMTPLEQEEQAYEWRARRLAEAGFPPWEEAIAVYRRLALDDLAKQARRRISAALASEVAPLGFALVAVADAALLLRDALAQIDEPALREACVFELARLANRLVIADGHGIRVETIQQALHKAIGYVNIGLELASDGRVARATNVLHDHWLTPLFQLGFHRVTHVAEAARRWLAAHPMAREYEDITSPTGIAIERIRAASWKFPKYYVGPHTPDGILHREFQSLADLAAVEADLVVPL